MTVDEVIADVRASHERATIYRQRWAEHYRNRLAYERAMLAEAGGTVSDRTAPEVGGAVQCLWAPRGGWAYIKKVNRVTVTIWHQWSQGGRVFSHNEPLDKLYKIMTRAEVEQARAEGRIREAPENMGFWLLQSREEFDKDNPPAPEKQAEPETQKAEAPKAEAFQAMRETLKAGVQVISAPQLFPTPRELAQRVADLADVQPGMRVLEPSAGTGALLGALGGRMFEEPGEKPYKERDQVHAVEISQKLADRLRVEFPLTEVHRADFLSIAGPEALVTVYEPGMDPRPLGLFDRVLMNPPFADGADIKHIRHAMGFLKPGGRLVAICANGPRQAEALKPIAAEWHDLPPGSFKESGTLVNTALLVIERPE